MKASFRADAVISIFYKKKTKIFHAGICNGFFLSRPPTAPTGCSHNDLFPSDVGRWTGSNSKRGKTEQIHCCNA